MHVLLRSFCQTRLDLQVITQLAHKSMTLETACFDCTKYEAGDAWSSILAHFCILPYAILLCQGAVGSLNIMYIAKVCWPSGYCNS